MLYEIAPRMDPQFALRGSDSAREELRRYIRKYILVPKSGTPAPKRDPNQEQRSWPGAVSPS